MALLTVPGASSGATVNVTVDGANTDALATTLNGFGTAVGAGIASGTLDGKDLTAGSSTTFSSNNPGYGVITQGGAYTVSGNVGDIVFGGPSGNGLIPSSHMQIDASGVTSKNISVEGGTTGGVQFQAGSGGGTFVAGTGNNAFTGDQVFGAGDWNITTGSGNDTIVAGSGSNTIDAGTGKNVIDVSNGTNYVHSYGQDTIFGSNCAIGQHATLYGGSSVVELSKGSFVNDASSNGDNDITVRDGSTISGGMNDHITLDGGTSTVLGASNDTITASGNAYVDGVNSSNVSVDGSLTFLGGTGNSTITASQSTIFGSNGLDAVIQGSGSTLFVATYGNDTLDGSGSGSALHAFGHNFGTSGTDTFIGGTASDTLVAGVGDATMTGGSGDANIFAFRDGVAGANYTITDFGSAAGNLVALQGGFTANDVSKALANETVSGGNTTITLSDNSTITFQNFTNLQSSDFTVW